VSAIAVYIGLSLASFYLLWVLFLAVMNLKRVKDAGMLSKTALVLGTPVLILGLVVDAIVNVFVMTLILLEMPKESTVTARLKRHNRDSGGWRKAVVLWMEPLLDPFDPSGDHV
jgi:predicted transporter